MPAAAPFKCEEGFCKYVAAVKDDISIGLCWAAPRRLVVNDV